MLPGPPTRAPQRVLGLGPALLYASQPQDWLESVGQEEDLEKSKQINAKVMLTTI